MVYLLAGPLQLPHKALGQGAGRGKSWNGRLLIKSGWLQSSLHLFIKESQCAYVLVYLS